VSRDVTDRLPGLLRVRLRVSVCVVVSALLLLLGQILVDLAIYSDGHCALDSLRYCHRLLSARQFFYFNS